MGYVPGSCHLIAQLDRRIANRSTVDVGVIDHVAEPGTSALDRAYALAKEMQGCGKSKRIGILYITRV